MATDHNFKVKKGIHVLGSEGIYLTDTNTRLHEGTGNALRISTGTGYIDIGSMNSSWAHFQANKNIYILPNVSNGYVAIDGDLQPYSDSTRTLGTSGTRWSHIYGDALTVGGAISSGAITASASSTIQGNLLLDADNAEINLKSGVGTTSGAVNWTFNSTGTDYASIKLPYATRATTGFHVDSGYPITIDATTRINFAISGNTRFRITNTDFEVGTTPIIDLNRNLTNIGTINTGQGATEVYLMNQNVRSSDSPTFQDLTIQGNLSITGDINSYNVTDLDVVDKTITLGVGGTASANDGGGIVVDGANAKLTWNNTGSYWQMNKKLAFNDTATTSNQGLGLVWTGFDKEATSDSTDSASIVHTTNAGGHTGSVLYISAQNDANDGIAFITNASSPLKHNSSNILTAANFASNITSVSNADTVDSLHAASFLRSDAADTGSGKITLTAAEGLEVFGIRGRAVGSQTGDFIQMYERVSIGYPSGWGAGGVNSAPTQGLATYGGAEFNKGNVSGAPFTFNGNTIWHAGNDGTGTGLDADLLDGQHGSYYRSASNINTGTLPDARLGGTVFRSRGSVNVTTSSGGNNSYPFDDAHTETRVAEYGARLISYTGASATMLTINTGGSASVFQIGAHYNGNDFYMRTRTDSSTWQTWKKLWHTGNDGASSGLDADLLDGVQGSSYLRSDAADTATGVITFNATPTLGGTSGNEGGELNFGAPTGGVYSSFALDNYQGHFRVHTLASGKEFRIHSASSGLTTIGSNLGTVWASGNDGSGSGLDADLLDGVQGASYLRSDANDTFTGTTLSISGSGSVSELNIGTYGSTNQGILFLNGSTTNKRSTIKTTNGNLHIDPHSGNATYLNYSSGSGIYFGTGAGGVAAVMGPDGDLWKGSGDNSGSKYWHAGNDGSGSGLDADLLDGKQKTYYEQPTSPQSTNVSFDSFSGISGQYNSVQFFNLYTPSAGTQSTYNSPTNVGAHHHVMQFNGYYPSYNNWKYQSAYSFYTGDMYTRNMSTTTWQSWARQWSSVNDGSGSGLDADLLDGQHASAFATSAQGTLATNALPKAGGTMTGTLTSRDIMIGSGYNLQRSTHQSGHFEGGHNNLGNTSGKTSPIYTIGSSYNPDETTLSNMYGIGFSHINASFINVTGGSGWGMYVASDGDARIFLDAENGTVHTTGAYRVGSNIVWHAGNDGSGSGLDADTVDGTHKAGFFVQSGSWLGDLGSNGYTRENGLSMTGGSEFVVLSKGGQGTVLVDGQYISYEGNNGFFGSYNSSYGNASGIRATAASTVSVMQLDGGNANLAVTGSLTRSGNTVWDTGNDGSGSGLDADLLDGQQGSAYKRNNETGTNAEYGPWYSTGTYIYDSTNSTRYYWLLIGTIAASSCRGMIEYEVKDDENYPHSLRGTLVYSGFNSGGSFSVQHDTTIAFPAANEPQVRLDTSRRIWMRFPSNDWASYFRFRVHNQSGNFTTNTSWSTGSTRYDTVGSPSSPPNASSDILPGQNLRATSSSVTGTVPSYAQAFTTDRIKGRKGFFGEKLAVGSGQTDVHSTYHLYNNNLTYLNGATIIDDNLTLSGGGQILGSPNITAGRVVTSGLYGTGHGSSILPIWQYNASNPGYGIGYYESSPDALRIDVSSNLMSGTPDFEVTPNTAKVNGNTVFHTGNDGSGSGLDADLLDGLNSTDFLRLDSSSATPQYVPANRIKRFNSQAAIDTTSGSQSSLEVYGNNGAGTDAFMTFHVENDYAIYLGLDGGTNKLSTGGWSAGAASYEIYHAGNKPSLATLGFTGASNANYITNNTQLTNGAGYITTSGTAAQSNMVTGSAFATTSSPGSVLEYQQASSITDTKLAPSGDWYNTIRLGHGNPYSYYSNTMAVKMTGTNVGQLYIQCISNNTAQGWRQVWDSSSDGSGSGLDADLLDGQHGSYYTNPTSLPANGGNSDTVDGLHAASFLRSDADDTVTAGTTYTFPADDSPAIISTRGNGGASLYVGGWSGGTNSNNIHRISSSSNLHIDSAANGNLYLNYYRGGTTYIGGSNVAWHAGNDGSGSGLDADLLDGYNSAENGGNTIHRLASNGYSQIQNWINVLNSGLYSTSVNGAHFSPNTVTSYGSWRTSGSRNGYDGIVFDSGGDVAVMFDSGGNGGMYRQGGVGWMTYFHQGNDCLGVCDSTTSSTYGLYLTGALYATADIVAYSDRRVKENIVQIDNALEKVNKLEGVYYNRIDNDTKNKEIGFIAQDVNEVAPELVTYAEDVDQYGVKYGNTTALLVEAVKELTQQVKDLKQEVEELKNG